LISAAVKENAGTAGLRKGSVAELAKHKPAHIHFSGRNSSRASRVIDEIKANVPDAQLPFVPCDLASFASIDEAGKMFASKSQRLDILICNAGIMAVPADLTKDGYEIQFGTNHLGHALLIKHFLPIMLKASEANGDARIVSLTLIAFRGVPSGGIVFKNLQTKQEFAFGGRWFRYSQSKFANILYGSEIARRYPSIPVMIAHPGVIKTDLVNNLGFADRILVAVTNIGNILTPEQGVHNQLWAATVNKNEIRSGAYYEPVGKLGKHSKYSQDARLATELWDWTHNQLKNHEL
jgi:NAD(P)-dependent dehydrogenase (short-subunit alcohol dehydrogenase family)